jgi:hypothetical protein
MPKSSVLVLCGVVLGCAATAVVTRPAGRSAHAAGGSVAQYCTSTGDFNNVQALDDLVKTAGRDGWELVGVYRPAALGATHEDYVCFRRE